MRIAIDAIGISRPGGVRSAALNWLRALFELDHGNQYLLVVDQEEAAFSSCRNVRQVSVGRQQRVASRLRANIVLPFLLRSQAIDLVHHLKDLGLFFSPCKSVITVHGLSALLHPRSYPRLDVFYQARVLPLVLRRADRVVAVSQDTARDLGRHFGLDSKKIAVVYPCYDPLFRPMEGDPAALPVPQGYILHVGSLSRKKNIPTILKAYQMLRDRGVKSRLVLVERAQEGRVADQVQGFIRQGGLEDEVVLMGPPSPGQLASIYGGAAVFVFPSIHESFGIAPLEAMACGVPVVAADVGGMGEMLGGAAMLLADPLDAEGLAQAVASLLQDGGLRRELSEKGLERARAFSPREAAQRLLQLYQEVSPR